MGMSAPSLHRESTDSLIYHKVETVGTLGCVSAGIYIYWGLPLVKWTKALPTLFFPFSPDFPYLFLSYPPTNTHTHTPRKFKTRTKPTLRDYVPHAKALRNNFMGLLYMKKLYIWVYSRYQYTLLHHCTPLYNRALTSDCTLCVIFELRIIQKRGI